MRKKTQRREGEEGKGTRQKRQRGRRENQSNGIWLSGTKLSFENQIGEF